MWISIFTKMESQVGIMRQLSLTVSDNTQLPECLSGLPKSQT